MKKLLIFITVYVICRILFFAENPFTSEPSPDLSRTAQSKSEGAITSMSYSAEDETRTYGVSSDHDKSRSGPDRMEELESQFPGYRIVDGENDSDTTYAEVCSAIEAHEDVIVIYRGTENAVSNMMKFRAMSDFQYFWLDGWNYSVGPDYIRVNIRYLFDTDETQRISEQIDSVYWDIQYSVTHETDGYPWDAARYVYDYLSREVTYDSYAGPNIRNIYGALIEKRAVCAGYAAAFDYLMSRMGYQVGIAGNDNHSWNYMHWDSDERFIDVTWGDTDRWDAYGNYYINYSFMGLDFSELQTLEDHSIDYCYISGRGFYGSEIGSAQFYGSYDANYCDVCGYSIEYYSYEMVRDVFYRQLCGNDNSLIVKFSNVNELYTAVNELTSYGCDTLSQILGEIGYYGYYQYEYNEACNTFVLYLYTQ